MSAPYPQLLSPDQIQVTPLNYEKYVDLENELSQEELVQFILQLRDKFVKDTKSKVGFNNFSIFFINLRKWIVNQSSHIHLLYSLVNSILTILHL
jgi:hypothetical protein